MREAYSWFDIPAQFRMPIKRPYFDFKLVTPEQMIEHRYVLKSLEISDSDIKEENFLAGRLADLSATYVLSDLMHSQFYNLDSQCHMLKMVILRHRVDIL